MLHYAGSTTLPYKLYYTLGYTVLGYTFKPFNVGISTPPYQLYYTLRIWLDYIALSTLGYITLRYSKLLYSMLSYATLL